MGHYVTYGVLSIAPVGALILNIANYAEVGVKLLAAGVIVLAISVFTAFWVCGRSLLRGIDQSLQQQAQQQQQLQRVGVVRANGKETPSKHDRSKGDAMLLAARTKVKMVMVFTFVVLTKVVFLLSFSILSPYGVEAPLLFFISPMTLVPPIWNIVNVKIHQGRSKLSREYVLSSSDLRSGVSSLPMRFMWPARSRQHQVAVETITAAP